MPHITYTLLGILLVLTFLASKKTVVRKYHRRKREKEARKVHKTEPQELHCPICWRTASDLKAANKLQQMQGYAQCAYHGADLDYGELPPKEVAAERERLNKIFQSWAKEESTPYA